MWTFLMPLAQRGSTVRYKALVAWLKWRSFSRVEVLLLLILLFSVYLRINFERFFSLYVVFYTEDDEIHKQPSLLTDLHSKWRTQIHILACFKYISRIRLRVSYLNITQKIWFWQTHCYLSLDGSFLMC